MNRNTARTLLGLAGVAVVALVVFAWPADEQPADPVQPPLGAPGSADAPWLDAPRAEADALLSPTASGPRSPEALAAPDAAASLPVSLAGRVVDGSGAPVAGARVHVVPEPPPVPRGVGYGLRDTNSWSDDLDDWWRPDLRLADVAPAPRLDLVDERLEPFVRATTAADGSFALDAELPAARRSGRAQPFLLVLHPEFAPACVRLVEQAVGDGALDDVVMSSGVALRGRVVDTAGRPIDGAHVRLGREWHYALAQARVTDPSGTFEFTHVDSGPHELRVEHPAHVTVLRGHSKPEADTDLGDIVLPDGGALAGRVLDARGQPVERAHVFVSTKPVDGREMHPTTVDFEPEEDSILLEFDVCDMPDTAHALTDAAGRFRIDRLPLANHTLYARHPEHEPARLRDVVPGATLEVRLDPRVDQLVRVADAQGAAVPGLDLRAWRLLGRSGGRRIPVVTLDAVSGLLRIEGLGFRDTHVAARAPGFADARWTLTPAQLAEHEVYELTLQAGYAIDAEVVDAQGERLEGWDLFVRPAGSEGVVWQSPGSRGTGPSHRFDGLPAGDYEVHTWPPRFGNALVRPAPAVVSLGPDAPVAACALVPRPGATLTGTLSSPDETPHWWSIQLAPAGEPLDPKGPRAARNRFAPERYTLSPVPPGEWSVHLDGRFVATVTLVAGETTTLDLDVPPQARIEGLVSADGAPVAGARVQARYVGEHGASSRKAVSGPDGRYELRLTLPGPWELGAVDPAAGSSERPQTLTRVEVPEHGVAVCELALPGGRLRARVVREDGLPAAGRKVWLHREPEGYVGPREVDELGEVRFEHLAAGRWQARLGRSGEWTAARSAWVEVSGDGRLVDAPDVLVRRGFAIHGRAFVAPGVPAPAEAAVRLWNVARDEYSASDEVRGGGFRFEGLSPGDYRLALFRDDMQRFDDGNGQLGVPVTLIDADVEVELLGAADDAP